MERNELSFKASDRCLPFLYQDVKNQDERSGCWKKQSHKFNTSNPFRGGSIFFQQVFVLNYFTCLLRSSVNSCLNDIFLKAPLRF